MAISFMDQLKKLDEQQAKIDQERQNLMESAFKDAKAIADAAVADLNSLGYSYQLVERSSSRTAASPGNKRKGASTDKPCPICNFRTDPPHDKRRHRSQAHKQPFTAEELASYGLKKIG